MARSWQHVLAGFDDAELAVVLRFLQRSGDMLRDEMTKLQLGTLMTPLPLPPGGTRPRRH